MSILYLSYLKYAVQSNPQILFIFICRISQIQIIHSEKLVPYKLHFATEQNQNEKAFIVVCSRYRITHMSCTKYSRVIYQWLQKFTQRKYTYLLPFILLRVPIKSFYLLWKDLSMNEESWENSSFQKTMKLFQLAQVQIWIIESWNEL